MKPCTIWPVPQLPPSKRIVWVTALLLLAPPALAGPAHADEGLWRRLAAGGQLVLLRHGTTTPGVGDPTGFRLDDCATQRNLTEAGREESRRIGAALEARAVPVERVLSSPWCRCLETARHAAGQRDLHRRGAPPGPVMRREPRSPEGRGDLAERPRAVTKIASLPAAWGEKNSTTERS